MGFRGRTPVHPTIRRLRGEGVKSDGLRIEYGANDPEPPAFLGKVALEEWHRLVKELGEIGVLRTVDRDALASFCTSFEQIAYWSTYKDHHEHTLELKELMHIDNQIRASQRIMTSIGQEFGLSPASRSRIQNAVIPPDTEEDDGLLDA